jgi:hypothetical protein
MTTEASRTTSVIERRVPPGSRALSLRRGLPQRAHRGARKRVAPCGSRRGPPNAPHLAQQAALDRRCERGRGPSRSDRHGAAVRRSARRQSPDRSWPACAMSGAPIRERPAKRALVSPEPVITDPQPHLCETTLVARGGPRGWITRVRIGVGGLWGRSALALPALTTPAIPRARAARTARAGHLHGVGGRT